MSASVLRAIATTSKKGAIKSGLQKEARRIVKRDPLGRFLIWLNEAGLHEKDHQMDGMKFCIDRETAAIPRWGARGGIIADEMGLGKTILMLGCIVSNFRGFNGRTSSLIVVPPALLAQWKSIIVKFMGHFPLVYHGSKVKLITTEQLETSPIVLTTYGMVAINKKKKANCPLWSVKWNRLILDEAHHIRNMRTGAFAGAIKLHANIKWLVTGTPIQNRKTDLVALCCVLGLQGALRRNPSSIKEIIKHHLLRRTKKSVGIKLPPLNEQLVIVPWASKEEENLSKQIHHHANFSRVTVENVDALISELTHHPLPMLTRARQSCIFPHLLNAAIKKMQKQGRIPVSVNLKRLTTCSKATAVAAHLARRKNNSRRKIVFCHYRGEIDLLSALLKKWGVSVGTVDGRTRKKDRKFALEYSVNKPQFLSVCKAWSVKGSGTHLIHDLVSPFLGPQVIVVQINTACEGLNLQHFQEVYFTSPHWNPAVEDQAIARAHRIGQNDKVDVFRFVMADFKNERCECGNASCKLASQINIDSYCQMVQEKKRELMKLIATSNA